MYSQCNAPIAFVKQVFQWIKESTVENADGKLKLTEGKIFLVTDF